MTYDLNAQIDALFARWARPDSPGVAVSVILDGREIHRGLYGMADLVNDVPLDARSVIRIGSQSKQFTVFLLLMLEAEGKLSLNDDVREHLPWLPEYPEIVTLRHLAANVGGLRDYLEMTLLGGLSLEVSTSEADARSIIGAVRSVNFPPGADLVYCNTGFFLLSDVVEKVSGKRFNDLLTERITGPLGMRDTQLMPHDSDIVKRLASQYTRGPDGAWRRAHWGIFLNGVGGMVSTLGDMQLWLANLGAPKVGTQEMVARMSAPGEFINGHASPYGLGLVTSRYRGLSSVGHYGSVAGGRSYSARFPEAGIGVIILGNNDEFDGAERARRVVDACLNQPPGPSRSELGTVQLRQAVGLYRAENGDDVFRLHVRDGEPMLDNFKIEQLGPETFRSEEESFPFEFTLRDDGDIDTRWFGRPTRYRRLADVAQPVAPGLTGMYGDDSTGLQARIWGKGTETVLRLSSAYGTWDCTLEARSADLYLATPCRLDPNAPPFTIRAVDGGIVLNDVRTKKVFLARLS